MFNFKRKTSARQEHKTYTKAYYFVMFLPLVVMLALFVAPIDLLSSDLNLLEFKEGKLSPVGEDTLVKEICRDQSGQVWVLTASGDVSIIDQGALKHFATVPSAKIKKNSFRNKYAKTGLSCFDREHIYAYLHDKLWHVTQSGVSEVRMPEFRGSPVFIAGHKNALWLLSDKGELANIAALQPEVIELGKLNKELKEISASPQLVFLSGEFPWIVADGLFRYDGVTVEKIVNSAKHSQFRVFTDSKNFIVETIDAVKLIDSKGRELQQLQNKPEDKRRHQVLDVTAKTIWIKQQDKYYSTSDLVMLTEEGAAPQLGFARFLHQQYRTDDGRWYLLVSPPIWTTPLGFILILLIGSSLLTALIKLSPELGRKLGLVNPPRQSLLNEGVVPKATEDLSDLINAVIRWVVPTAVMVGAIYLTAEFLPPQIIPFLAIGVFPILIVLPILWAGKPMHSADYETALRRAAVIEHLKLDIAGDLRRSILSTAGRYEEAKLLCEEGLRKAKGTHRAVALANLADVYNGLGKFDLAEQLLEEALAIDATFPSFSSRLAWVFLEKGVKPEEALELAQRASKLKRAMIALRLLERSEFTKYSLLMAWALFVLGRHAEGEAQLTKAQKKLSPKNKPEFALQNYLLGRIAEVRKDTATAQQYYHTAITADPQGGHGGYARKRLGGKR